jgi:transcriptional regulator with XRE-family HTH domain
MNNEMKYDSSDTDFQGEALQMRLRREALGLSRVEAARLCGVEESTVYRWEHLDPAQKYHAAISELEYRVARVRKIFAAKLKAKTDDIYVPDTLRITGTDLHIIVPKPGVEVGDVWMFGEEEPWLARMPAGAIRILAGIIIKDMQETTYRLFAREMKTDATLHSLNFVALQPVLSLDTD